MVGLFTLRELDNATDLSFPPSRGLIVNRRQETGMAAELSEGAYTRSTEAKWEPREESKQSRTF